METTGRRTPAKGRELRPAWQRYGGAVLLTLAVIAARAAANPLLGHNRNRHLVFLPAVMLAAWWGGLRAGLISAALSTVALYVYWSDPRSGILHVPSPDLVLFIILSAALCYLIDSLQRARAHADAAAASRERVLQVVAHDLRNPLSTIETSATIVGRMQPSLHDTTARIHRAVARMDALIRDLIDTTHIERGDLAVALRPEALESMVRESTDLFSPIAAERNVALDVQGLPTAATVACDRSRIMQVLGNLLGNSFKFTPASGRITLSVVEQPDAVRLTVSDTGAGIAPDDLPHVFEQYWKASGAGIGLGLFIARSIVQAHGGRIWVESKQGAGATFSFTLPRNQ